MIYTHYVIIFIIYLFILLVLILIYIIDTLYNLLIYCSRHIFVIINNILRITFVSCLLNDYKK